MTAHPIPKEYHTVTPYLIIGGVAKLMEFLRQAFGAVEVHPPMRRAGGGIMHAEMKIGDSIVMMGEPMGSWRPMPSCLYLYVEDVDTAYRRAMQAGATSVQEPADQFYGDRNAGVKDSSGNLWFLATHKEDLTQDEMMRRYQATLAQKSGVS